MAFFDKWKKAKNEETQIETPEQTSAEVETEVQTEVESTAEEPKKEGFFAKLKKGLGKTNCKSKRRKR